MFHVGWVTTIFILQETWPTKLSYPPYFEDYHPLLAGPLSSFLYDVSSPTCEGVNRPEFLLSHPDEPFQYPPLKMDCEQEPCLLS
mmetsp:Transcript_22507/g.41888  ORF Transcript_22507/g.41888 Transcript_22507/m.41888 type:complete len:85 (+) Transcript_22507:96-350(+)